MLKHRLYYILKPYLPWSVRMVMRRITARRILAQHPESWPINPAISSPPRGWTGWPDGKRFAVVLTHDVEGRKGLERCRLLADLEAEAGFRSSFNFIPEGSYKVPAELRAHLAQRGFEVGVHDLKHDGMLYNGRESFQRHAQQINQYIRSWGAVGFRSGFMYHNQEWIHDLDIEYDASTFDTDPFEPQPEGANTIFPFWVPPHPSSIPAREQDAARRNHGYVELPYTLPQDSTLYLVLQETTNNIWRRKLDWIVKHGGMVLVNVHPDYLPFRPHPSRNTQTVFDFYKSLLNYIATTYRGMYWHPLPREMAAFVRDRKEQLATVN